MTKTAMAKKGRANGRNGNVGVAAYMIVEGKGGAGNVTIHARIVETLARGRTIVPGEIVERGGNYVQECPSQHKCNIYICTMYSHAFHKFIAQIPARERQRVGCLGRKMCCCVVDSTRCRSAMSRDTKLLTVDRGSTTLNDQIQNFTYQRTLCKRFS